VKWKRGLGGGGGGVVLRGICKFRLIAPWLKVGCV
jgi:hypothetical protein